MAVAEATPTLTLVTTCRLAARSHSSECNLFGFRNRTEPKGVKYCFFKGFGRRSKVVGTIKNDM